MSNEKLAEQLDKLKEACAKWEKELAIYTKWAIDNDGVISAAEKQEIDRRKTDIAAIKARIAQIEKAKGIQPKEEKSFLEQVYDGAKEVVESVVDKVKDFFDTDESKDTFTSSTSTETTETDTDEKTEDTTTIPEEPKNKLGLTKEQVKDKLGNFFAAFDKFTVVVEGTTVEVETPYYMNEKGRSHKWDGNTVTAGKGSPKEVQEWLQEQIDKGKIKSKDPAKLRQYLKDNKIGVDCSGFVSQALNHVADKEGDMEYGSDDEFRPDGTGSGVFLGNKFTKIAAADVQIGDTLYFKNPKGGVNHIRIVGDVRHENGIIYYTIFESAGRTGPRKMEWKFEDNKLMEFNGSTWKVKTSETFYRWKELDMDIPNGGGSGQGQQQDQHQNSGSGSQETLQPSTTLSASVGKGGSNKKADVLLIQELLNKKGASLKVDGDCGAKTIAAIEKFQRETVGFKKPDGRVDPGGKTWNALASGVNPAAETTTTENSAVAETGTINETTTETSTSTDTTTETTETSTETTVVPNGQLTAQVGTGKANKPGDVAAIQSLLNKNGYSFNIDGIFTSELAAAIEKFQKEEAGLSRPDGVVDPGGKTWNALNGVKPGAPPKGPLNKPNWIKIAEGELGQKEKAGSAHNPRIVEYHSTTGGFQDDETAWCSSFVNWVMQKAGQGGTNSAAAVSWARWGKKVDNPAYGAIAVIDWDGPGPGWKGHVGFVVGMQGSSVLLLGGNQSNSVNVASFGTSKIIAYVYPSNFEIPANFYTFGEADGDFGGDTNMSDTR